MPALLPWENADRTRIGRLRVQGGTESTSLRLALSGMLDRCDLRPPGVPPSAVLIVRHMSDPLPGRIAARQRIGSVDGAWERAARDQLAALYRRAARPGRNAVPGNVDAVVFADDGELLASLALDLVGGRMRERWWWRSLTVSLPDAAPPALAALLCSRATWVPAALALLSRHDRAAEIVRALSPREALAVLAAVSQAHGVSALAAAIASPRAPMASDNVPAPPYSSGIGDAEVPRERGTTGDDASAPGQRAPDPPPPWSKCLPLRAIPAEFERAHAGLLGIALTLHHRPEAVRSASFAMELRRWWHSREPNSVHSIATRRHARISARRAGPAVAIREARAAAPRIARATTTTMPPPQPPAPAISAVAAPPPSPTDGWSRWEHRPAPGEPTGVPGRAEPLAPPPAASGPTAASDGSPERASATRDYPAPPSAGEDAAAPTGETVPPVNGDRLQAPRPVDMTLSPEASEVLEGGVDTALGGVLFLINVMCALDLPECFEEGWRLASAVGAWGVLAALGHALLAADDDEAGEAGDPIWPALAALSGTGKGLGAGLPRRASYSLPAAWAARLPADWNEPQGWAARGGKLRLWSRSGYVLSEISRDASPADAQARGEARRWGLREAPPRARFGGAPLAAWSRPPVAGFDRALRRWLSLVVPFIRLRLVRALGIDPLEENLREAFLARPGRLYVTATHVDLVMGLGTVSLPVRFAGLDRSPGWLGEFGRVILFHFE